MSAIFRPTTSEIKHIRKAVRDTFGTVSKKDQWTETYRNQQLHKAYGLDPNKSNSKIGKEATAHLLDSDGLREELSDHTPIDHPPVIPPQCNLHFTFTADLSEYMVLAPPLNVSQRFENTDKMRNIFDDRLYNSKLIVNIAGTEHEFFVKSIKQSGTAFVRAFGIQVSSYIMRYRPLIYIQLDDVMMELSGTNIGIGFCNLTEGGTYKGIIGHQMIHFHPETMDKVNITFYGKNGISIHDITLKVVTFQQKNGKMIAKRLRPLILFNGKQYLHFEGNIVDYDGLEQVNTSNSSFNDSNSNESPSPSLILPNIASPTPPIFDIDCDHMFYRRRDFGMHRRFGDLRNGMHRQINRSGLHSRNEQHIENLKLNFSTIPKFQF